MKRELLVERRTKNQDNINKVNVIVMNHNNDFRETTFMDDAFLSAIATMFQAISAYISILKNNQDTNV